MKPDKKENSDRKNKKMQKKKGNNSLIIIAAAAIIFIGAYALLSGDSVNTEPENTMTLKEVRALIDKEYGDKAPGTATPPVRDDYIPILSPRKADKLPDFAVTNAMTLKAYKYATEHPEVLEQIPCYCGCGEHGSVTSGGKPHISVRDCFISNDGVYDDHASFCDVCVGIAIKAQSYFPDGVPITGMSAATPAPTVDLSTLSLPENFRSIADGLKLIPEGVARAYFVNIKMITGTEVGRDILAGQVEPDSFYGKKLIGMFSGDYSADSWIELHDLGYDSKNDTSLKARTDPGMKNIIITRPLVYGHSLNVDNVMKLMNDPKSQSNSFTRFKPLLEAVDYQNAGYALVRDDIKYSFSDMSYFSLTPFDGNVELVKAFNITEKTFIPSDFSKYNPEINKNILVIKMTGDFAKIKQDNDNIDALARS